MLLRSLKDSTLTRGNPTVNKPSEAIEKWRMREGYSNRDVGWDAILEAVKGIATISVQELANLIEKAPTLKSGGVILSTFHSAKGSEFKNVFILDAPPSKDPKFLDRYARKLYVGFTRAKVRLNILFCRQSINNLGSHHPSVIAYQQVSKLEGPVHEVKQINSQPLPESIEYSEVLDLGDLYFSSEDMIEASLDSSGSIYGKSRVAEFSKLWGKLYGQESRQPKEGLHSLYALKTSSSQASIIVVLSTDYRSKLKRVPQPGTSINKIEGYTICLVEGDPSFANVSNPPEKHFVVIPKITIQKRL